MSSAPPPCRLYILLARQAPVGVIFRRGPSKWVQITHWDTATDTFTPGQWFHGRIYEKRCDISFDGKLLLYFAEKINHRTTQDQEYSYSWTAISKPPYLTALALWPCGSSGGGGGTFIGDTFVWLNHWGTGLEPHPDHLPQGLTVHSFGIQLCDEPLFFRRMMIDEWKHIQEWKGEFIPSPFMTAYNERLQAGLPTDKEWWSSMHRLLKIQARTVTHIPGVHEKPHPDTDLMLVMTMTKKVYESLYSYHVRCSSGAEEKLHGAEWADWDQHGRLVYAEGGKIFALEADAIGQEPAQELANFNSNVFEPMEAPNWAKEW